MNPYLPLFTVTTYNRLKSTGLPPRWLVKILNFMVSCNVIVYNMDLKGRTFYFSKN